ncbi:MAG: chorismate-binding protein, partial [Pseudomonadota bacterium]
RLKDGLGPVDALAAAFPCGSITGAPKHRAMQVISRLENEGRGPYCGSVAYIPANAPAVFSVAIRTATLSEHDQRYRLDYRTGGGVTALSDPAAEYIETEDKAYGFAAMVR